MPTVLYSFKKDRNGRIILHGFCAPNAKEAEKMLAEHAAACPQFGPAHREGQTIDIAVDIDELPEFEESSLEEFLELDDEEDEDDDEPEGADSEDEEEEDEDK